MNTENEQEAVAWVIEETEEPARSEYPHTLDWYAGALTELPVGTKLYATPVAPLTDEQIRDIACGMAKQPWGIGSRFQDAVEFARAILAAAKEPK